MAAELNTTNPLDFPRYVRSLRPSLPESLPTYVDDELDKLSTSLQELEQAANNHADARVEEERIVRVTEDEALAARIVTVEATFDAAISDTNARVTTEEIARATADEAIASRVTTVEAEYKEADAETNAKVTVEELARTTADEALAARIESLEATFRESEMVTNAKITQETYVRATEDEAMAQQIDTIAADMGDNSAAIITEQTARVNADNALASSISTLSTTVAGNTASISTQQSSINGLELRYSVKLDSNGYITGFEQNNNGSTGSFVVRADEFKVVTPGQPSVTPFSVTSGGVRINGNLVVSGSIVTDGLAPNAVTTSDAVSGSLLTMTSSSVDMVSLTASASSATGAKTTIFASCQFLVEAAGGDVTVAVYLNRDGSAIKSYFFDVPSGQNVQNFHTMFAVDTPSPGSHTYTVTAVPGGPGTLSGQGSVDLFYQETKR